MPYWLDPPEEEEEDDGYEWEQEVSDWEDDYDDDEVWDD